MAKSPWKWPNGALRVAILFLAFIGAAAPLKDVRVVIPQAVERHKDAVLRCVYNMEGEKLYSIKWYKGQNEFYRYTPGENPPEKVFLLKGINVMRERSDARQVALHKVDLSAEGRYACEVSADAPSFTTSMVEGRLTIVEVPRHPPNIQGLLPRYRLGDNLRANCSTEFSHPPANLTIYINGQQYVPSERVRDYKLKESHQGQRRSVVGVDIKLLPEHFGLDNKLKIRCLGTIYDVYNKVDERSVELRTANMMPPNVLETNQPPREPPFDQDPYNDIDKGRPRNPDPSRRDSSRVTTADAVARLKSQLTESQDSWVRPDLGNATLVHITLGVKSVTLSEMQSVVSVSAWVKMVSTARVRGERSVGVSAVCWLL